MAEMLVVDLGFSSAKYLFGGKKGRIPSGFRPSAGGYVYGEDAMVKSGSSYLKTLEELIRHYPAFVDLCRVRAGADGVQLRLAVGLPYLFWSQENRPGGQAVEQLRNTLKKQANIESFVVLRRMITCFRA